MQGMLCLTWLYSSMVTGGLAFGGSCWREDLDLVVHLTLVLG